MPKLPFASDHKGARRRLSRDLCIIGYFFVARGRLLMLYFERPQINVPRGRPFREFFPPQRLQLSVYEK
jgi:hypothetical protein